MRVKFVITIVKRVMITFHFISVDSAAAANQCGIVRKIFGTELGRNTISTQDEKGRNVFHYGVENPEMLKLILTEHKEV